MYLSPKPRGSQSRKGCNMTDPKNIPLSEARPGDIVYMKPMVFDGMSSCNRFFMTQQGWAFSPSDIDHIERAPRPLEVGAPVKNIGTDTLYGTVIGLRGKWAWVLPEREGAPPDTVNTLYLEPVDD